jgi:hypothetical protein
MGLHHMTTKQKKAFTTRALMALTTAMGDQNYRDAEVIVAALAKAHGVKPATTMRSRSAPL